MKRKKRVVKMINGKPHSVRGVALTRNLGTETEAQWRNKLINALRRVSTYWKPAAECIRKAKCGVGVYKCAECGGEFKRKEVQADHVEPVVDIKKGFEDFNTWIGRCFKESPSAYQCLCKRCHSKKSKKENALRRKYK